MLTEEQKQSMPKHVLYFINRVPNMMDQTELITNMFRKMEGLGYAMVGVIEHRESYNYIYHFYKAEEI